jgi:hypothetical protein
MRSLKFGVAVGAVTIAAVLPATAPAQAVVPPGNSAANQYTETAPSAGGDRVPPGGRPPSPAKALGAPTADRLNGLGATGRATAALAAAGAPPEIRHADNDGSGRSVLTPAEEGGAGPEGSSGFGRVLGQATGLSSTSRSGLLVLAIIATCLWSVAYLWRRRGRAV